MSRCTQGTVTNWRRKSALRIRPPSADEPTLDMSAYQLSISCQYSSTSGSCQIRSPARTAAAATSSYHACGAPNPPLTRCPNARATAPVSVATSTTWVAPRRSAYVMASPRMRRPSASVLMTSTVLPFSAVTMSPGRVECGPGMFSTAGATTRRGVPGARRATVAAAASTVQAPVLSVFISSIRSAGLMEMPPESKQTPFPTSARWRPRASFSPSPPERITIMRGGLALPRPTARNMPIPSSAARTSSMTSIQRPWAAAIARASSARTSGLTSLAARLARLRVRFDPSPMMTPRAAAAASVDGSAPGATRISSSSAGGDASGAARYCAAGS